ncbi:hypothetical protein F5883DRAFT_34816 [Diaporthe sp. PMI_573]|nr:hypothetical protein F5883DRAFT_34816 [Diaporthaceae sp. PMI_573]
MLQCCLLAMQTAIWPELSTCSSQRDSIYPAIVTSLACIHRIKVGAGFRLLPNLARVTKLSVQRQQTTHADMQRCRQLSWAPHGVLCCVSPCRSIASAARGSISSKDFREARPACLLLSPLVNTGLYVRDYCELRVHIYTPQVPPECRYATM